MINYTRQVTYVGRNGMGNQKGLEIELRKEVAGEPWRVTLEPVNSKGDVANCKIEIPAYDLEAVIRGLQQLQAEYESRHAKVVHNKDCELGDNHKDCPACSS